MNAPVTQSLIKRDNPSASGVQRSEQQGSAIDYYNPRYFEWERLYISSLSSDASKKQTRSKLSVLRSLFDVPAGGTVPWMRLTINTVNELKAALAKDNNGYRATAYSHSSINSFIAVIKGVLKAGVNEGHLASDSTAYRIITGVKALPTHDIDPSKRPAINDRTLALFLRESQNAAGAIGSRDSAICHVLVHAGLRRSEICWLKIDNYDRFSAALDFKGKGNKIRHVRLTDEACTALDAWIENHRGDYPGPMFPAIRSDETIDYARALQPESVNYILVRIQQRMFGHDKQRYFSPHQLRYSFASRMLSDGVDLSLLQKMLGHASMHTTGIYDRRNNTELDQVMQTKGRLKPNGIK